MGKRFIALLRGINVGGHNKLPMKELKALLEGMGCSEVVTYIQSGNLIFQHQATEPGPLAESIGVEIERVYGFRPEVTLLAPVELETAIANNPFQTDPGKALHFYFLKTPPALAGLEKLEALKSPSELFHLTPEVFYLWAPEGVWRSKLAAKVEACLGVSATARNGNTVARLQSMLG